MANTSMQQIRLADGIQISLKLVDQGDETYALAVSPVDVIGGDTTNNVLKVAELCTLSTIATADGQLYTGVGTIVKFFVGNTHATETATIQLYDNTAASGVAAPGRSRLCGGRRSRGSFGGGGASAGDEALNGERIERPRTYLHRGVVGQQYGGLHHKRPRQRQPATR